MLRHVRAAFQSDGTVDRDTIRWWGAGEGSPIESVPEQMPDAEVIDVVEDEVIWGGCVVGHFGHFLIESVSRLWPLLPGEPCEGMKVVFTTPSGPPFTREWLQAFGAKLVELPAEGAVRFERMRVPEPAWRIDAYVAPEVRSIHLRAREGLEVPGGSDCSVLWLSRSAIEVERRVRDESLFESMLEGTLTVVHPEALTLAEQVAAVESADAITGSIGSGFHAALMAREVPELVYFTPARVASTFAAQDWLLGAASRFVQTLAIEQMHLPHSKRRETHRLLIPETLRALHATVLRGLLDNPRLSRFAAPELPAAVVGEGGGEPDLDVRILRAMLDSHSIDARMELGSALEAAGQSKCALEQFFLVSDWTEGYAYGPLRAARLLAAAGEFEEAAAMAKRVLEIDPDSEEAARYAAA